MSDADLLGKLQEIADALHLLAYVTNPQLYHKALSKEYSTGVKYREWLKVLESVPDDDGVG